MQLLGCLLSSCRRCCICLTFRSSRRDVQGDAASLKADVRRLVAALSEAHEEAAASVATLARIDAVKGRMQAAHDTLRV